MIRARLLALVSMAILSLAVTDPLRAQATAQGPAQTAARQAADDPDRWEPTIAKFEASDKTAPPPANAIVFVGSSSIVRWNQEYFPDLGPKAINRGFGGSLLSDSGRYADRVVIPYKPRIVVFYAGDNDIGRGATAADVAARFDHFVSKVQAALPDTRIVFISIKPSIQRWQHVEQIRAANALIRQSVAKDRRLAYVDIDALSIGPDGKPKPEMLVEDGLHLTPEGYRVWTAALKPYLTTSP